VGFAAASDCLRNCGRVVAGLVANSAIIVTKKGLVIVDSQSRPSAARSLYGQFKREVATFPVRYVINMHHHLDHAHGNEAYVPLFSTQVDIVSTTFARAAIKQAARWFSSFVQRRPVPSSHLQEVPNQERYYAFVESYIGGLRDSMPATEAHQIPHLVGRERAAAQDWLTASARFSLKCPYLLRHFQTSPLIATWCCTATTSLSKYGISCSFRKKVSSLRVTLSRS
jgi:hypothetical protein